MSPDKAHGQKLKELLYAKHTVIALGCYDAVSARLVQEAGFQMAYMSGLCVAASLGYPDVGLISWTDMVERAALLVRNLDIPLLVDADSGYGGPQNIREAVKAFERVGVAGLHLEDQPVPKKCAALPGKALISPEMMEANIRVALESRVSSDFVIVARTDAFAVSGLTDAITRAQRYERAGADATLIMSVAREEDMVEINASLSKPTLVCKLEKKRPLVDLARLSEIGYPIAIYPLTLLSGQVQVQRRLARGLMVDGSPRAELDSLASIDEINELLDLQTANELDQCHAAWQLSAAR